jgi:hypothetical protein
LGLPVFVKESTSCSQSKGFTMETPSSTDLLRALEQLPPRDERLLRRFALERVPLTALSEERGINAATLSLQLADVATVYQRLVFRSFEPLLDNVQLETKARLLLQGDLTWVPSLQALRMLSERVDFDWNASLRQLRDGSERSLASIRFERIRQLAVLALVTVSAVLFVLNDPLAQGLRNLLSSVFRRQ